MRGAVRLESSTERLPLLLDPLVEMSKVLENESYEDFCKRVAPLDPPVKSSGEGASDAALGDFHSRAVRCLSSSQPLLSCVSSLLLLVPSA